MKNHPFWSSDGSWEIRPDTSGFSVRTGWRSSSQAMPALGAAGANDRAPPKSGHTDEKAMSAFAANHRRLISTFHDKALKSLQVELAIRY
jgi:hypothetical protein